MHPKSLEVIKHKEGKKTLMEKNNNTTLRAQEGSLQRMPESTPPHAIFDRRSSCHVPALPKSPFRQLLLWISTIAVSFNKIYSAATPTKTLTICKKG